MPPRAHVAHRESGAHKPTVREKRVTLIISWMLAYQMDLYWTTYPLLFLLWVAHVGFHKQQCAGLFTFRKRGAAQ